MANTKREKLFTEFPPVPTEKWEEVIKADLKGADYKRKLVWRTGEGFNVRPYYRAENLEGLRFLGSQPGEFPYVRGTRANNHWHVHQTIRVECPKAANEEALKLLNAAHIGDADLARARTGRGIEAAAWGEHDGLAVVLELLQQIELKALGAVHRQLRHGVELSLIHISEPTRPY